MDRRDLTKEVRRQQQEAENIEIERAIKRIYPVLRRLINEVKAKAARSEPIAFYRSIQIPNYSGRPLSLRAVATLRAEVEAMAPLTELHQQLTGPDRPVTLLSRRVLTQVTTREGPAYELQFGFNVPVSSSSES
jgi:hypothetical protein